MKEKYRDGILPKHGHFAQAVPHRAEYDESLDVGLTDIDFEGGVTVTDLFYKSGSSTIGDAVLSAETTNQLAELNHLKLLLQEKRNSYIE